MITTKGFFISTFTCLWLTSLACGSGSTVASEWSDYELVSSDFQFSLFSRTAAAVDSSGYLHVLYAEAAVADYENLYHQWYDGTQWQTEVIDADAYGQGLFSLGFDSTDTLHLCYIDNQDQIKYAWGTPGAWSYATVDLDSSHPRSNPMLTIDGNDKIHICYMADDDTIRYSSNASGTWQSSTAVYETFERVMLYRMLCNSSNQPIICYQASGQHKYALYNAGLWQISDSVESIGYAGDAAVDSSDHLHLCFYNDDGNLCYATDTGGSWTSEVVGPGLPSTAYYGLAFETPVIMVDDTDTVNIFYRQHDGSEIGPLLRAYGQSGAWTTETLASVYTGMTACPLENLTGQCELITYSDMLHGIEHFKKDGPDWTRQVIAQAVAICGPTTLAMDINENVQIFHFDILSKSLLATSFDRLTQSTETSFLLSEWGIPQSLTCAATIDNAGARHLLLTGQGYGPLNYWTDAGGQWQSSNIDPNESAGYSLTLGPSGTVYAAYYDAVLEEQTGSSSGSSGPFGDLDWGELIDQLVDSFWGYFWGDSIDVQYYYTNELHISMLVGSSWQTEVTVPAFCWAGCAISDICVDASENLHCVYIGSDINLLYLTNAGGSWQQEQVDPNVIGLGNFISLDMDTSGCPHIAYVYDDELKYAYKQAGVWTYETLTNNSDNEIRDCTIELDVLDKIYICYYDEVAQAVMLAQGGPGAWSHETIVDECGNFSGIWNLVVSPIAAHFGGYPSMVLDADGKVHISYYRAEDMDALYNVDGSIHYVTNAFEKPGISVNRESIYWMIEKNATAQCDVTVTSCGSGPLAILDTDVTGPDAAKFVLSDDYIAPLNPGQECVITIDFDTSVEGTYEATLMIESNDPAIPVVYIPMTVRCYVPPTSSLYSKTTYYDFESVVEGTESNDLPVRVTNGGTTSLSLQSVIVDDDINYTCETIKYPIPLGPGESYITWVRFTPQSTGRFDAVLYISASGTPPAGTSVQLTGIGIQQPVPEISFYPFGYDFGDVQYSAGFAGRLFTIDNLGDADLTIFEFEILDTVNFSVDPNAGKSPIGPDMPVTIPPKQSVTFIVFFHPTAIGQFDTTVKIFSSDDDEHKVYLPVTGRGIHWNVCDFNVDGYVNIPDFAIMAAQWLNAPGSPPTDVAPTKLDDWVDVQDLAFFAQEWLKTFFD